MSEQVNNTEKFASEDLIQMLKKILKPTTEKYAAKNKQELEKQEYDDLKIQLDAVRVLQQIGKDANSMVPELIEIVKQDDTELAAEAALALGSAGLTEEQAKEAVPVLITALTKSSEGEKNDNLKRDERSMIKNNAALTLGKVGKPAVPGLIPLLSPDTERMTRIRAAEILGMIGQNAQEAAPYLLTLLEHEDKEVQLSGAITLAKLKTEQDKALSVLLLTLNEEEEEMRVGAAAAIGEFGTAAKRATPNLIACIKEEDAVVASYAIQSLQQINPAFRWQSYPLCIDCPTPPCKKKPGCPPRRSCRCK